MILIFQASSPFVLRDEPTLSRFLNNPMIILDFLACPAPHYLRAKNLQSM